MNPTKTLSIAIIALAPSLGAAACQTDPPPTGRPSARAHARTNAPPARSSTPPSKTAPTPSTSHREPTPTPHHKSIACGTESCDTMCCVGQGCVERFEQCQTGDSRGHGVYHLTCDGPEDCPQDQICCVGIGAANMGGTECSPRDACNGGAINYEACHAPDTCPPGNACLHSIDAFPPTLLVCGPPAQR